MNFEPIRSWIEKHAKFVFVITIILGSAIIGLSAFLLSSKPPVAGAYLKDFEIPYWIQVTANVATAIALFFVAWQTKLTSRQMDANLRPWIGVYGKGLVEERRDQLVLTIKNYGGLPTTLLKVIWRISKDEIDKREIQALERSFPYEEIAIIPTQIYRKILPVDNDADLALVKKREQSMSVGVMIKYTYPDNKSGEYGIIFHYGETIDEFVHSEVWAK
jgi:hypothetical protein